MESGGPIMGGFTKLFSRILTSSIWSESNEVRIVWITLLAATGPDGTARVTLPGLSRLANISLQKTEKAVEVLASPDRHSRTQEHEGRRIREERDEGGNLIGYFIYNFFKHRAVDGTAAERQRRHRAKGMSRRDRHGLTKRERESTKEKERNPEGRSQKAEERTNEPPTYALPPDVQTETAIRNERWKKERSLYAVVGRIAEKVGREAGDVMEEVTAYKRKDGSRAGGRKRPELLRSDERVEKSLDDANAWLASLEATP
jgi:hypothetical protein